jgi:hypothetical protein
MHVTETSFERDGDVFFRRIWRCHGHTWEKEFRWNDLEGAAWCPVCPTCEDFDGTFFI